MIMALWRAICLTWEQKLRIEYIELFCVYVKWNYSICCTDTLLLADAYNNQKCNFEDEAAEQMS